MPEKIQVHLLHRVARLVGGTAVLRERLRVPRATLEEWLAGRSRIPDEVFLRVVDLLDAEAAAARARHEGLRGTIAEILGDALRETGASRGNVQVVQPEGLRIVGHVGFEQPFLDFFSCVSHEGSACGSALLRGARVVVPDVATDPIFAGTRAAEVMLQAGCHAVQSTPLRNGSGEVIGMLSTHYETVHAPSSSELRAVDAAAAHAAAFLLERPAAPVG